MRTLILMRGAPGAGKSTFIEKHGLTPFTISPDTLRLLFQSPEMTLNSSVQISSSNDRKVWKTLFNLVEDRMKNGDLTVIDATHTKAKDINQYRELANTHRYRTLVVDFGQVDLETLLKRNTMRSVEKIAPQQVIENMHQRITSSSIPTWTTTVDPEKFEDYFHYKPRDLSHYKRIHHFGDIHGCFDVLSHYLKDGINEDEFYIFVGDYIDRGIQNTEVLNFLFSLMNRKNVVFLEGNHEIHLWNWANDKKSYSREFESYTKAELNEKNVSKKTARAFYRSLNQCVYYSYKGKQVLVTHGGVSYLPENLLTIPTQQLIKGVGDYSTPIDQYFHENTDENTYQIHGHRNIQNFDPQVTNRTFNLEGRIEQGGHLRIAILDDQGFHTQEIKNNTFSERFLAHEFDVEFNNQAFLDMLRANPLIKEKKQTQKNISSFSFDPKVFYNNLWDEQTVKARGLFINTQSTEIVARSYEKFFNLGETSENTLEVLHKTFSYPVVGYTKENGFLGITGYDSQSDTMIIASKSTTGGLFKDYFENILYDVVSIDKIQKMKEYMRDKNTSMIFEVIDPINDPHLIKYAKPKIVLLDIIYRTTDFSKLAYPDLVRIANEFELPVKSQEQVFSNWEEFNNWYNQVKDNTALLQEGFVIEDADGFTTKIKLPYYTFWKYMRSVKDRIAKGKSLNEELLNDPASKAFISWLKENPKPSSLIDIDIITLRETYEKEHN